MQKDKKNKEEPNKKVKTRGTVHIPGGLRDVLMGTSKEISQKKQH